MSQRQHQHESVIQKSVAAARSKSGVTRHATPTPSDTHSRLICSKTAMIPARRDTIQELLGYSDVSTTMINKHVLNKGGRGVRSPADALAVFPAGYSGQEIPPTQRDILPTDQPQKPL